MPNEPFNSVWNAIPSLLLGKVKLPGEFWLFYWRQGLKDKKLKAKLKNHESKFGDAAIQAARSELLLPEEAG
jgi:hypothetical protein